MNNVSYYDKQLTCKIAKHIYTDAIEIAQYRGLNLSEYMRSLIIADVVEQRSFFNK